MDKQTFKNHQKNSWKTIVGFFAKRLLKNQNLCGISSFLTSKDLMQSLLAFSEIRINHSLCDDTYLISLVSSTRQTSDTDKVPTIHGNKKRVIHSSVNNATKGLRHYVMKFWVFMKLFWYNSGCVVIYGYNYVPGGYNYTD